MVKKKGGKQQVFPEVKGQSCSAAFVMREGFEAELHLCFLTVHQLPERRAGACCRSSARTFAPAGGSLVFAGVRPVFVSPASLAFQTVSAYENPSHLFFQETRSGFGGPVPRAAQVICFDGGRQTEKHIKEGIANEEAFCCFFIWSSSTWLLCCCKCVSECSFTPVFVHFVVNQTSCLLALMTDRDKYKEKTH